MWGLGLRLKLLTWSLERTISLDNFYLELEGQVNFILKIITCKIITWMLKVFLKITTHILKLLFEYHYLEGESYFELLA